MISPHTSAPGTRLVNPFPSSGPAAASSSETNGPASTSAVEAAPQSLPGSVSLSPEALMAYCQSRLNSLDSQMNDIFKSQQQNATVTNDINAIAEKLGDLQPTSGNGSSPTVVLTQPELTEIKNLYATAIADAGKNTQLGRLLFNDEQTLTTAVGQGSTVPTTTISTLTQSLKNDSSEINSNSELTMINLQSLMSQRETAIQLSTNLIQSLGTQSTDITKNIGA